jgi:hypothetical protein
MKHFIWTIIAASTILTGSLSSVLADNHDSNGGDVGTVQNSNQTSIITGDGNVTNQSSQQINRMGIGNGSSGDAVSVQESDQYCDILGNDNACNQRSRQKNTVNRSYRNRNNANDVNRHDD